MRGGAVSRPLLPAAARASSGGDVRRGSCAAHCPSKGGEWRERCDRWGDVPSRGSQMAGELNGRGKARSTTLSREREWRESGVWRGVVTVKIRTGGD